MADHFPFLSLIPELRLEVYEHVFADIVVKPTRGAKDNKWRSPAPGLLLTCKQIYAEAVNTYYSSITIAVPEDNAGPKRIENLVPESQWGRVQKFTMDITALCGLLREAWAARKGDHHQ